MGLIVGYKPDDAERISEHLRTLLKYINPEEIVMVGGIPLRYHFSRLGVDFDFGFANDLDMMVGSLDSISADVTKEFKVGHFHNKSFPGDGFYVTFIHPPTKTKTDVFSFDPYPPLETVDVDFEGTRLKIRTLEDQLSTMLLEISRVFAGTKTYKHFIAHVEAMIPLVDVQKTVEFFKVKPGAPEDTKDRSIEPAGLLNKVKETVAANPDLVIDSVEDRKTREPYDCPACEVSEKFPLTPMGEVFEILEWYR